MGEIRRSQKSEQRQPRLDSVHKIDSPESDKTNIKMMPPAGLQKKESGTIVIRGWTKRTVRKRMGAEKSAGRIKKRFFFPRHSLELGAST